MNLIIFLKENGVRIILALIFLFSDQISIGQTEEYQFYYRVYFRDKGANSPVHFSPDDLLSERAVTRRTKHGIIVPDYRDLPVFREYINEIATPEFLLHCTSKWMNTALFKTKTETDIAPLLLLPFVSDVKLVKRPAGKSQYSGKLDLILSQAIPPPYDRPITMLNGNLLHNSGYDGSGVLIAVLDGGFTYTDRAISLSELRNRHGIKHTYDFVRNNSDVYNYHTHGTSVLSVLAGLIDWQIKGTAPGADFLLLRTEDGATEFPVEEDFWVAGAEFADSAGADIISSSLGYFMFDDPEMNYKYSDLDGNSTFITLAADIAASKGILVVNSAGNERDNPWLRIIAPSDGDSVLAAGAVDGNNIISSFSSAGPSADGQVKPDNCALGVSIVVQSSELQLARSAGTSFSCPVLSGMSACLMQAVPDATNLDIINALHLSSDKYNSPDSLYGYGIPDMVKALKQLQDSYLMDPTGASVAWPNPTMGDVEFVFSDNPGRMTVEVISITGKEIYKKVFTGYAGRNFILTELNNREQGLYFVRFRTETGTFTHKIVKLRN